VVISQTRKKKEGERKKSRFYNPVGRQTPSNLGISIRPHLLKIHAAPWGSNLYIWTFGKPYPNQTIAVSFLPNPSENVHSNTAGIGARAIKGGGGQQDKKPSARPHHCLPYAKTL
jgi:hypothetical protein